MDSWDKHRRRDRILKRIAYGVGALVFGGLSATCAYALFLDKHQISETQTTNTTTTTTINGVSHTTTNVQTVDVGAYAPLFFWAGLIFTAVLTSGAIIGVIWPDGEFQ